jgi:hypothetical protein
MIIFGKVPKNYLNVTPDRKLKKEKKTTTKEIDAADKATNF